MSIFARQHYEAIAKVMQTAICTEADEAHEMWIVICDNLRQMFHADNPQFDVARFERACEPGANVKKRSK